MNDDTISRQAAIDAMMKLQTEDIEAYGASIPEGFDGDRAVTALKALPSAQPTVEVVPVRHGRWEEVPYKTIEHGEVVVRGKTVRCSACRHAEKGWSKRMNFCPNCGARMDGDNGKTD